MGEERMWKEICITENFAKKSFYNILITILYLDVSSDVSNNNNHLNKINNNS